jgi:hypothetical protein
MNKLSFYGIMAIAVLTAFLVSSCDHDFSEMGSGIVDDNHFAFAPDDNASVRAYTQVSGVAQSNNFLIVSPLGLYNNPVFGKTKANFVTQLELPNLNTVFLANRNPVLDSVVLTIPYFNTKTTSATNEVTFKLDSIIGESPINLKVFESGYLLSTLDPSANFQSQQLYYTNENAIFDMNKKGLPLNNSSDVKQNVAFEPSGKEILKLKLDRGLKPIEPSEVETRSAPRMRLKLDKAFFDQKIMNAPAGKLSNNSIFREYFRGIYFQVENAADGALLQLDFSKGDITLHYHEYATLENGIPVNYEVSEDDSYGGTPILAAKTFVLNMRGIYVSLLETENANQYAAALSSPNRVEGDSRLYLKGGEGSIAVIDLFGPDNFGDDGITGVSDGISDELNIIRKKQWLVNEANLTFYIDRDAMGNVPEPQRLYLYDLNNKRPLLDWGLDPTGSSAQPKRIKNVHDGIIQELDGRGAKYRIRVTNHIRNIIRKDSTNVRLGLCVTEAIGLIENVKLKNPQIINGAFTQSPNFTINHIPAASLINPLGTILYGNNIAPGSANYEKRLKLEVYYTKPN